MHLCQVLSGKLWASVHVWIQLGTLRLFTSFAIVSLMYSCIISRMYRLHAVIHQIHTWWWLWTLNLLLLSENRPSRFSSLQIRSIRPCQWSNPLPVPPCSREPRDHEGIPEREEPAVEGAEAQTAGWSDYLQACLLNHICRQYAKYFWAFHPSWCTSVLAALCSWDLSFLVH